MTETTFTLTSADGAVDLAARGWPVPDGATAKAAIVIAHGLAEHGARYAPLAADLNAAGYAVYIHDHRGHGDTAPSLNDLGFFADEDGWGKTVDDIDAMVGHVRAVHPGLAVVLLGHSMGGLLAQHYAFEYGASIDGLVLSGTTASGGALARLGALVAAIEARRLGKRGKSALLHDMAFGKYNKKIAEPRTAYDWLSRDPAVVDAYDADPRCGFVASAGLWQDLLGGLGLIGAKKNRQAVPKALPIYIFTGDGDPVNDYAAGARALGKAYREAQIADVLLKVYPGGRHEMLNETNRDQVIADLIAWLDERFGPAP